MVTPKVSYGPVEAKVRTDVAHLITAHPMAEALAEMAYCIARALDGSPPALAIPSLNRELRNNLLEMARLGVSGDDDIDARLSTPELRPPLRDDQES